MSDIKKTPILKEALTNYNEIMNAAKIVANKKLVEEYSNRFNEFVNEELNKNKTKESYKKMDDNKESNKDENFDKNKESVMKNNEKETKKVKKTADDVEKQDVVDEDVKITDTVGESDPYEKKVGKNNISEKQNKGFMNDVESDTPNIASGKTKDGDTFKEKTPKKENIKEEFDITELDINQVGSALENANESDEFQIEDDETFSLEDIENEINSLEFENDEIKSDDDFESDDIIKPKSDSLGGTYDKLHELRNQLDEILQNVDSNIPEPEFDEHNDDFKNKIQEFEVTDADIDAAFGETEMDETLGISYPNKRATTGNLPDKEYQTQGNVERMRFAMRESNKKINGLINENKKLTKKLNENKKFKETISKLLEQYKTALEKYRNQLKEMATFNTNLAHVNNLLVNENLALTYDDKINIINNFKKIDSIAESQKKYGELLNEMQNKPNTLSESVETKVSASIHSSSKQKLDEVVEKTAYEDNQHINKIKKLIEYAENRSKK